MKNNFTIEQSKTIRRCLFWGAVFLTSQICIAFILNPLGIEKVLELQLTGDPHVFRQDIALWQDQGLLERYRTHFYPDMLHPLWYCLFLSFWAFSLFRAKLMRIILAGFSISAALCDMAENLFHMFFLNHPTVLSEGYLKVSSTLTEFKWIVALGLMGLFTVVSIIKLLAGALRRGVGEL